MTKKENLKISELFNALKLFIKNENFDSDFRINAYEIRNSIWGYRVWAEICYQSFQIFMLLLFLGFGTFTKEASLAFRGYEILPVDWGKYWILALLTLGSYLTLLNYFSQKIRLYFIKICYKEMLNKQGVKQRVFLELFRYLHDKRQPFEEEIKRLTRESQELAKV